MVIPDRRPERRAALLERLEHEQLDGLIVSHLPNIRYLTGFTGSSATLLVLRNENVFFSDFRYRTQAEDEVKGAARIEIYESDIWDRLWTVLGEYAAVERLGFESGAVSGHTAERIALADVKPIRQPMEG